MSYNSPLHPLEVGGQTSPLSFRRHLKDGRLPSGLFSLTSFPILLCQTDVIHGHGSMLNSFHSPPADPLWTKTYTRQYGSVPVPKDSKSFYERSLKLASTTFIEPLSMNLCLLNGAAFAKIVMNGSSLTLQIPHLVYFVGIIFSLQMVHGFP